MKNLSSTVVIPARNEQGRIRYCLNSLKKQTIKPHRIIVVDNNSTDNTKNICLSCGVDVIEEKETGIINARNRGFDSVNTDIIIRTDADTTVPEDWIEKLLEKFNDKSVVAVSGPAKYGAKVTPQIMSSLFVVNKIFFDNFGMYGPNMAIRTSIWKKVRKELCSNEKDIHEDFDLGIHAGRYGKVVWDTGIIVETSARRAKTPKSLLVDYSLKWAKTIKQHSDFFTVKI